MHIHSLTLTLLIVAERYRSDLETAAYVVIDKAMVLAGYSDEYKADLYARIAESVTDKDTLVSMQRKISAALDATDKVMHRG